MRQQTVWIYIDKMSISPLNYFHKKIVLLQYDIVLSITGQNNSKQLPVN